MLDDPSAGYFSWKLPANEGPKLVEIEPEMA